MHSTELRAVIGLMRESLELGPTEEQLQALSDADPSAIVRIASAHAVLPMLSQASGNARVREFIPTDLGFFLAEMHKANSARNVSLREQLIEIGTALQGAGICAVALKGAIELLAPIYPHGTRYIGDLDLLVPEDDLAAAADRLRSIGYEFHRPEDHAAEHHHLPVLWHPERPAAVELHRRVGTGLPDRFLPASLILAEVRSTGAAGLAIPSPRCRLLHLLSHSHVRGAIGEPGFLFLRDFTELAVLKPLLDADDWAFTRARSESVGARIQLDGFCEAARVLLYAEDEAVSDGAAGIWVEAALSGLEAPRRMRAHYLWSWLRHYTRRFYADRAARKHYLRRLSSFRSVAAAIRHHATSLRNIA